MNGSDEKRHLDDDAFGAKGNIVSAFDAFPKAKPQYVQHTSAGGKWTVAMALVSAVLFWSELARWWRGTEQHTFAVEKGVSHILPINLDVVVRMRCADLRVNVQDASGDRIHAASALREDPTLWSHWVDGKGVHRLGRDEHGRVITGEGYMSSGSGGSAADHDEGFGEEHVHDIVALGRKKAKWSRTPRLWGAEPDSCRIYGSLELNKVQGDFHITARGHGYAEMGQHLDHKAFNFSHIISELSFGPFLPSLVNPLDRTVNTAPTHFHKFQYFLSVVPTAYSVGHPGDRGSRSILTNQYAVTEQTNAVADNMVPGIFVKYDIEPILLNIVETRDGFFVFLIKVVNVISGVLVAGHWGFRLTDWAREVLGRRRRARHSEGMLGKAHLDE
ncbi:endoplasmic reticulum vesicle transporter-domain-containing protein [Corynascus novoguineensis]|uniref:Endoplasmic reticulum-Golgi intermediate compartment protein n=1 Tax=Corynascus novoguineensis TaxID=1126955 RepID=A0AAN7D0D2_9PEZI|nr:endoplasmic reticulum vesicle transporter-domain-containing protein [Corynascus novoguineensis]